MPFDTVQYYQLKEPIWKALMRYRRTMRRKLRRQKRKTTTNA